MGNLTIALTFVLFVNVFIFLVQAAVLDINDGMNVCDTYKGGILAEFDKNNNMSNPLLDDKVAGSNLPTGAGKIEVTDGNVFTDTFGSIKTWIEDTTGLTYIKKIVSAPYTILQCLNLPTAFTYAMGTLWYAITFFLIVSFFWGRE